MALPLPSPGDVFVACGDSITADFFSAPNNAWYKAPGGFLDQITARILAARPPSRTITMGRAFRSMAGTSNPNRPVVVVNQGVGGSNIADINVATMVAPWSPKYVLIETGVNDVYEGITPANFQTSYVAVLDALAALKPKPYVLCLNILCFGEQWQAGPAWGPNPLDATILDMNTRLTTIAAGYPNVAVVDQRAKLLAWEASNNTPAPGAATGKFCYDSDPKPPYGVLGVHPDVPGRVLMGTWAMEQFV